MSGYLICATVYLLLLGAALARWRKHLAGSSFVPAISAQFAWSAALAAAAGGVDVPPTLVIGSEYLRDLAWALVLARCLAGSANPQLARGILRVLSLLIAALILGLLAWSAMGGPGAVSAPLARHWTWGALAFSLAGLVMVEQVARNTRAAHEWKLKYLWLALGAMFMWDVALHSLTLARGSVPSVLWAARGSVNALLGGLLAIGFSRVGGWRSAAFLSPRVAFFNATLLASAFYLLAMAAASYAVRGLGASWGAAGQAVFLAGAVLLLTIAVLSQQVRASVRVALAKNIFPYRYDYRSEWQKLTRALSQPGASSIYDRIGAMVAAPVSCSRASLWLRSDADESFVAIGGDPVPAEIACQAADDEFLAFLTRHEWIYDVEQAPADRARHNLPAAPAWVRAHPKLRLIVPLVCAERLVGFVTMGQPLAEMRLDWEEIDLLRAIGRQVAGYLALEQTAQRLAEAHKFAALNRVSARIMHDLRHLIAQQALVVDNAVRHRADPEFFDDAILTIEHSVKRMTRLMEELRGAASHEEQRRPVDVAELCAEVVQRCSRTKPVPTLVNGNCRMEVYVNRDRMLHTLEHVIRNAQDATSSLGSVAVSLRRTERQAVIEVWDTGSGMSPQFVRDRLFTPFESTKGERGMGIGAYESREFARRCGGGVQVESAVGAGTKFILNLPLAAATAAAATSPPRHDLQTT